MSEIAAVPANRLIDALPGADRAQVLEHCKLVELVFGQVLATPEHPVAAVYFPIASFISLLLPMGGKGRLEVAMVGDEGFFGVPVALGASRAPFQVLVQGAGPAWRIGAASFRRELLRTPSLRECVERYAHVLLCQVSQTAGCNHFHMVEQRVARWLLMTGDRAQAPTFHLTHEFLANMLGVRRVGITQAAGSLQARKLIGYSRGLITILDRTGLERVSCDCYAIDLESYRQAFKRPILAAAPARRPRAMHS